MTDFAYSPMFPLGDDTTEYELVSAEHVETVELGGETFLRVAPEALRLLDLQASLLTSPVIEGPGGNPEFPTLVTGRGAGLLAL